ncbi:hypothetical protein N7462_000366 [Penicillium macrosclerotiorum]|uniref:uncharacterized protein n=1 Tax=Penicillium macrosclerotiorum TaxID=303699 RepID=UPI002549A38E|nr:uncharacterized protein N7462_000366 [Penicillium macrosclerotiorum]KAJ5698361.1 hypothetical protein N7462_000366 [Penicillium macrosclerotiorum]
MSSGLPYLNKLRKPELVEFAEKTDLQDHSDLNKNELAVALDKHLSENRSIFSSEKKLADYYKRLSAPPRGASPMKREAKVEITPATEKKTPARRTTKQKLEEATSSDEAAKTPSSALRASARSIRSVGTVDLPASPAVVADAIDRQTTKVREGIEKAWTSSGVLQRSQELRTSLSSLLAIEVLILSIEGFSILKELLPLRYVGTTPPISAIHLEPVSVKIPDFFLLVSGAFWAPFLLWLLTGLVLPLAAAYFFNLSWKAAGGAVRRGRSAASHQANFDPLSFNIAKALLVYKVYVDHYSFHGLFSNYAIEKVNVAIPGQWAGMLTFTAIGAVGTLYEAILRS